jgi:HEAT repeat protein
MRKLSLWQAHLEAAPSLGEIGADAKAALPALRRALDHPDLDVRRAAAQAVMATER